MRIRVASGKCRLLVLLLAWAMACLAPAPSFAGPYLDSAHGDADHGVDRSAIDTKYISYAKGNCGHCHEMHASLEGEEPAPGNGASAHVLFAPGYNSARTQNPYQASDDFCFYCHSSEAGPQVTNEDYSTVFGGAATGSGPQTIMEAFNQLSYHNLYDIWYFLSNDTDYATWFSDIENPCSACHNSHLAKRNWDSVQSGFPLESAISRPGDHDYLWGETELMSDYTAYEAPYSSSGSREPAGIGDPDGADTPDYVRFCMSCHTPDKAIYSTDLARNLSYIDWLSTGVDPDKHGAADRDGTDHFREPYATAAASKGDFVLSCLDCHESHGSGNIMMVRRRINGENLEGSIVSTDAMSYACKRCHPDDLAAEAGTGQANKWEYVHHDASGAPYVKSDCLNCHDTSDGSTPVACGNCHGHGMDDSWAGTYKSGRRTF